MSIRSLIESSESKVVEVNGEPITLQMPSFMTAQLLREWVANTMLVEDASGKELYKHLSELCVQCLEACLVEEKLTNNDLHKLLVISGNQNGELAQTALRLCGFVDWANVAANKSVGVDDDLPT